MIANFYKQNELTTYGCQSVIESQTIFGKLPPKTNCFDEIAVLKMTLEHWNIEEIPR